MLTERTCGSSSSGNLDRGGVERREVKLGREVQQPATLLTPRPHQGRQASDGPEGHGPAGVVLHAYQETDRCGSRRGVSPRQPDDLPSVQTGELGRTLRWVLGTRRSRNRPNPRVHLST